MKNVYVTSIHSVLNKEWGVKSKLKVGYDNQYLQELCHSYSLVASQWIMITPWILYQLFLISKVEAPTIISLFEQVFSVLQIKTACASLIERSFYAYTKVQAPTIIWTVYVHNIGITYILLPFVESIQCVHVSSAPPPSCLIKFLYRIERKCNKGQNMTHWLAGRVILGLRTHHSYRAACIY